jgi:hypothetical protein
MLMLQRNLSNYKNKSNENLENVKKIEILLCAAAGTASHQHVLCMVDMGLCWKMTK